MTVPEVGPDRPSRRFRPTPVWIVAIAAVLALVAVVEYRGVFGPLLFALGVAYILEPVVRHLTERGYRRGVAVGVVFTLVVLCGMLLVAVTAMQAQALYAWIVSGDGMLHHSVENLVALLRENAAALKDTEFGQTIKDTEFWKPIVKPLGDGLKAILADFLGALGFLGLVVLTPIYTLYLMLDLERIWSFVDAHLPVADRERSRRVLGEIHASMAAFLRGRVVVAALKGLLTAGGLAAFGVPFAWVVGMLAGVLSVLPVVGPLLGFLAGLGVALAGSSAGAAVPVDVAETAGAALPSLWPLLWVTLVFGFAEAIENFVLTPWIMGAEVALHPLTVLFCVFFWGAVFGAFGALLAIPLTVVLKIVVREYVMPSVRTVAGRPPAEP